MHYQTMRDQLKAYYWEKSADRADAFCKECCDRLDSLYTPGMNVYDMKILQYKTITEMFDPVLFSTCPFYFELGTMWAHCDGASTFHGHQHAGGWTYRKMQHLFIDQDPALWELRSKQKKELFYLICGPYNDVYQHFNFDFRPVLAGGAKSLYERAKAELESAETDEQKHFLKAVCEVMLCVKKIGEKFSQKAKEMLKDAKTEEEKANLQRIADTACRVPWEMPENFYEALNTYALFRKIIGALEGIGPNTFGRLDMDLEPFYQRDLESGRLTKEEAYELISRFLVTFDSHYDHEMKMVGYGDHELENTYVLGGCDRDGNPIYNDLTDMFLQATDEEKIIFPKIKCRYSKNSPKAYLDRIDEAVIRGTSVVLYHNDDAAIPALVRAGRTLEEARDYIVTGCWGLTCTGVEKYDHGSYVNIIKPFEYSVHRLEDRMEKVGMHFAPLDEAQSFEEVYRITLDNIRILLEEQSRVKRAGGRIRNKVDPLPLFSSTLQNCLETKTDFSAGGAKYQDDHILFFGFPNIVDSLLAIKTLCFDTHRCTLPEMLDAVRHNWEGAEVLRREAMRCHGWGDGSQESCELANRLNTDLYEITQTIPGTYGGKTLFGHLAYTEIRFWGEKTLATPDGRKNGDYFSQGLTPSRLKKISSVTDVVNSLSALDATQTAGGNVVNVILPSTRMTPDICEAFLRATTSSSLNSLQLNCTTKEQLLDAQKHPEKYPDLIVRVCGFSAKFTSLSPEWQQEVLTRNFYD